MAKAIIEVNGFQYPVSPGDKISVPFMAVKEGEKVKINKVMMYIDKENVIIGKPYIKDALVEAEILRNYKDRKKIVFKMKRRKNYRRKKGHRVFLTEITVKDIHLDRK